MKELSKAEEMILLAIYRLDDNAYGVTIRQKIHEISGKDYTYGTLYGILEQMVNKNYLIREKGQPTSERGGRSKTFYYLTQTGVDALNKALEIHQRIWQGISKLTFKKS